MNEKKLRHEITNIIAKLDNGSHSSNQLQGVDEALFDLFKQYAAQLRALDACPKCGQVPNGQGGEYPCSVCGIPVAHDE